MEETAQLFFLEFIEYGESFAMLGLAGSLLKSLQEGEKL